MEASSIQFVSGDFAYSSAYGGKSATRKVKKKATKKAKKKQVTQKPVSSLQHWRGVGRMFGPEPAVEKHHDPLCD